MIQIFFVEIKKVKDFSDVADHNIFRNINSYTFLHIRIKANEGTMKKNSWYERLIKIKLL